MGPINSTLTPTTAERWRRLLGGAPDVVGDPPAFRATDLDLGGIAAAYIAAGPHQLRYTPVCGELPRADPIDFWYVHEGSLLVVQDGRCVVAQAGELVTTDRTGRFKLRITRSARLLQIPLPRRRVGPAGIDGRMVRARRWTKDKGPMTLLLSVLAGFCDTVDEFDAAATAQFGFHLTDLMALATQQLVGLGRVDQGELRTAMLHRIQGYAKQHLGDPSLDLGTLARQHNVSVRYVQKLFQEHGLSPSRWIRSERLARCLTDLKDPRNADVTIATIARRWGFLTPSYFTRVFREEYGKTPRQIRSHCIGV